MSDTCSEDNGRQNQHIYNSIDLTGTIGTPPNDVRFSFLVSWHSFKASRTGIGSFFQTLEALTTFDPFDHFFGVEVDAYRVLSELWRCHICGGLFVRFETIHLCFEFVAVGVSIVEGNCRTMIDTPVRFNIDSLSLAIRQEELSNVFKGEGNMLHNLNCWT